eukprot:CAMPEP_0172644232 /NCGR_PEP_ID=MMETSP1068-20121228/239105_1 /TAXON_ID=35684 /ORGANISM="Pseudopedinella elastica, Strain CCMP716" /LENGTH=455 /DNA_ID=CAMNT_0013458423 /DNA_START=71 /DNA_END=1439 /DNA_ORIENTATION=-
MGKNKHKAASKYLSGLSAEEWSDTSRGSQSGTKKPSSHDIYIKNAKEFQDASDKSSLDPQRILEPCILNGQLTVRFKSYDVNPASFPFGALTNIASDESEKERIMNLIYGMRAAVTPSAKTFNQRLVDAPSTIAEGESAQHDATRIADLEAELAILRARAPHLPPVRGAADNGDGASVPQLVLGVPEHSDGASHGGCASQDKGRDGASKYQGLDDTSGGSSHGDVSSTGAAYLKTKAEMAHPKLKAKAEMAHRDQVLMVMSHLKVKIKFPVLFTFSVRGVLKIKVKVEMAHLALMVMSHLKLKLKVKMVKVKLKIKKVKVKVEMAHQVLMAMSHLRVKVEVFPSWAKYARCNLISVSAFNFVKMKAPMVKAPMVKAPMVKAPVVKTPMVKTRYLLFLLFRLNVDRTMAHPYRMIHFHRHVFRAPCSCSRRCLTCFNVNNKIMKVRLQLDLKWLRL